MSYLTIAGTGCSGLWCAGLMRRHLGRAYRATLSGSTAHFEFTSPNPGTDAPAPARDRGVPEAVAVRRLESLRS